MLSKIQRAVGGLLIAAGLVLVVSPELLFELEPAPDAHEAIEQHVRWGLLICIGLFLVARTTLRPFRETVAHFFLWLSGGYLIARIIGIALEGAAPSKQLIFVGVEVLLCALAGLYLRRRAKKA